MKSDFTKEFTLHKTFCSTKMKYIEFPSSALNSPIHGALRTGGAAAIASGEIDICQE